MFRFISHLLGRPYEECKSCEILKQQLEMVNQEKRDLLDTLLGVVNPKVVDQPSVVLQPIAPKAMLWRQRRAMLEEQDRETAKKMRDDPLRGKSNSDVRVNEEISKLEEELGVETVEG